MTQTNQATFNEVVELIKPLTRETQENLKLFLQGYAVREQEIEELRKKVS